ncbi:putative fumarate reductase [Lentinula raphanica]|nr:putative fumarate reductase [Lentinula raphanica]
MPTTPRVIFLLSASVALFTLAFFKSPVTYWKLTMEPVIVVGGGLSGLSAAHSVLEHGGKVVLLDKKPALGGNSVKASSGINGAGTDTQARLNISDSSQSFYDDTTKSAGQLARSNLITALTSNSASAIEWLTKNFGVDLSLVSILGGHSVPRTHRGTGGAPGWAITSTLMKKLAVEEEGSDQRAKILKNSKVVKFLQTGNKVTGVEYEDGQGQTLKIQGPVVIATGKIAPELLFLAKSWYNHGSFLSEHSRNCGKKQGILEA